MLVDLKFKLKDELLKNKVYVKKNSDGLFLTHWRRDFMKTMKLDYKICDVIETKETGIYENLGFNFNHDIDLYTDYKLISSIPEYVLVMDYEGNPADLRKEYKSPQGFFNMYGVADSLDQIKKYFKPAIESDHSFVISFTTVSKDNQPATRGWRWHKWGEYIGDYQITREYLYDEPVIEKVLCFHGYYIEKS